MSPLRTAAVAGASGLVGGLLLQRLLKSGLYAKIIVLGRRELPIRDPLLEQRMVDFRMLEKAGIDGTVDDLFCALGTTIAAAGSQEMFRMVDVGFPLAFAAWGLRHGASRMFMVSSLGADPSSRTFYLRMKGVVETELRKFPWERCVIVRPAMLDGPREEFRLADALGRPLLALLAPVLVGRWRRYRMVHADTVAAALVAAARGDALGVHVVESELLSTLGEAS